MASALENLEREIRKLSDEDKERLIEFLMAEVAPGPIHIRELVREFSNVVDGMNASLAATLDHLDGLDSRLEQTAENARQEVLKSDYRWPFASPPSADTN